MIRFTTLREKLYAIIFFSLIVRVIGFFLLPSTATNLAPDEAGYAEMGRLIANGEPTKSYGGLYIVSRSLILPAAFLNKLGVEPLFSVRIIASVYGFLTLILLATVIIKTFGNKVIVNSALERTTVALFAIFAFLPSHLLWSLLGLRESPMEFWVLCSLATIYWAFYLQERFSIQAAISLVISITLLFNTRPQVGWVLGLSILIYLLLKVRNRIAIAMIPVTLFAIGLGYASVTLQTKDTFILTAIDGTAIDGTACQQPDQKITIQEVVYSCRKIGEKEDFSGFKTPEELLIGQTLAIPDRHKVNQEDAASAIQTLGCPNNGETKFDKYFCIAWRAPYMVSTFLFRPFIGLDVTSSSSLFAAVENIAWLGACIFIIVMLIRKRRLAFFGPLAPSLIFFMLYIVGAGSYEGNMGTAFRHKSLILWVVLLTVASVIAAQKKPIYGNENAEKAV